MHNSLMHSVMQVIILVSVFACFHVLYQNQDEIDAFDHCSMREAERME